MNAMQQLLTRHLDIWTAADTDKKTGRGRSSGNTASVHGIRKLRELIFELAALGRLVDENIHQPAKIMQLGEIAEFVMGQAPPGSECNTNGLGTIFVKTGEFGSLYPEVCEWTTKPLKFAKKGDVLICVVGATVGKLNLAIDCAIGRSVAAIRPVAHLDTKYIYFALMPFTLRLRAQSRGSAQGVIGKAELNAVQVRLPSLAEQHRIVAKVDELMALCDQLESQHNNAAAAHEKLVGHLLATLTQAQDAADFSASWQRIAAHFDTLFTTESSIESLKQTLLLLAVMGKLVPQDPNDEPARELLKRYKISCTASFAHGWAEVSLGELGDIYGGATPSKAKFEYWVGNIPWVSPKDMKRLYIDDTEDNVSEGAVRETSLKLIPTGSLLMVVRGMILAHSFPVALTTRKVTINQDMKALAVPAEIKDYMLLYMRAMKNSFVALVDRSSHGTCKLISEKLWSSMVAIPPKVEQTKIVTKVEELMELCDKLQARITDAGKLQKQLADVTVEQAIA